MEPKRRRRAVRGITKVMKDLHPHEVPDVLAIVCASFIVALANVSEEESDSPKAMAVAVSDGLIDFFKQVTTDVNHLLK